MSWSLLIGFIEPIYSRDSKKGVRSSYPQATMLMFHFLQQWYSLSDLAMEDTLI